MSDPTSQRFMVQVSPLNGAEPGTTGPVVDMPDLEGEALQDVCARKEHQRTLQNIFGLLVMVMMLFLVIGVNQLMTSYFVGGKRMPILDVGGNKPNLMQLQLDPYLTPHTAPGLTNRGSRHKTDRQDNKIDHKDKALPRDEALQQATTDRDEIQEAADQAQRSLSADQNRLKPAGIAARVQRDEAAVKQAQAELTEAEKTVAEARAAIALRYANRLTYLAFTTLYVIHGLLTLPIGVYVMWNTLRTYPPATARWISLKVMILSVPLAGTILRLWVRKSREKPQSEVQEVHQAIEDAVKVAGVALIALTVACAVFWYIFSQTPEDVDQLLKQTVQHDLLYGEAYRLNSGFNAFSMAVSVFLGAVAVCVIWHPRFQDGKDQRCTRATVLHDPELEARFLGVQLKQLRLILYIGTVVLILRILQTSAGLNWALAFLTPSSGVVHDSISDLVNSMVTTRAVYNTILLASIYFPTAALLSERISKLADAQNQGKTAADRKKWLDDRGLSFNFTAQVPTLIAILGPLLTPTFKEVLSNIPH